jgi:hypothetical protein
LAWFAAEQIAGFCLGRQRDDVPVLAAALHFREDAAGKVVLVPTGLDQDHPAAKCQPGQEVRFVPVPDFVAHMLGIGVLARADRVINQCPIDAKADNCRADSCLRASSLRRSKWSGFETAADDLPRVFSTTAHDPSVTLAGV